MDRPKELLAELQRLARLSEVHGSLEAHLYELTSAAARLLGAESCTVLWVSAEHSAADAPTGIQPGPPGDASDPSTGSSGSMLCSPIRNSGHVIAFMHVKGPLHKPCFDSDDLWLLNLLAVYIGKFLHAMQLQNLLHSRFAQIALVHSVDETAAPVPHPGRIVKILAKSFYREMTKAGFGTNEIINAASQIISELSASLKCHAKREDAVLPNEACTF